MSTLKHAMPVFQPSLLINKFWQNPDTNLRKEISRLDRKQKLKAMHISSEEKKYYKLYIKHLNLTYQ